MIRNIEQECLWRDAFYERVISAAVETLFITLIRARVERASYYLTLKNRSIPEVAELCGYQNEYRFIRQFKAETSTTPGTFRKR